MNDINYILFISLLVMEKISFGLSIISVLTKSSLNQNIIDEFRYRLFGVFVFIFYGIFFRYASKLYFE